MSPPNTLCTSTTSSCKFLPLRNSHEYSASSPNLYIHIIHWPSYRKAIAVSSILNHYPSSLLTLIFVRTSYRGFFLFNMILCYFQENTIETNHLPIIKCQIRIVLIKNCSQILLQCKFIFGSSIMLLIQWCRRCSPLCLSIVPLLTHPYFFPMFWSKVRTSNSDMTSIEFFKVSTSLWIWHWLIYEDWNSCDGSMEEAKDIALIMWLSRKIYAVSILTKMVGAQEPGRQGLGLGVKITLCRSKGSISL